MPNKPVRQSAKYKEQQYRKRMTAQSRELGTFDAAELEQTAADSSSNPGTATGEVSTVRFAPAGSGSGAATATAVRPTAAPVARPAAAAAAAARRPVGQANSAVRSARGRIAAQMQEVNLADEMEFIRLDIRRLLLLALASFAVLIVLAFLIH